MENRIKTKALFAFLIIIVFFLAGVFNYRSSKKIADRITNPYTSSVDETEKRRTDPEKPCSNIIM